MHKNNVYTIKIPKYDTDTVIKIIQNRKARK